MTKETDEDDPLRKLAQVQQEIKQQLDLEDERRRTINQRTQLEKRIKTTSQKVENAKSDFTQYALESREESEKIEKLQGEFLAFFAEKYRDPEIALRNYYKLVERFEHYHANDFLCTAPHKLGRMRGWTLFGVTSKKRQQALKELDHIHDFTGTIGFHEERRAKIDVKAENARYEEQAHSRELSDLQKQISALPEVLSDMTNGKEMLYKRRSELLERVTIEDIQKSELPDHERDNLITLWQEQARKQHPEKDKTKEKGREL